MTDLNIVDVIGRRVVLEKMGDVWGICPFHVSKEEKESKLLIAPTMIVNKRSLHLDVISVMHLVVLKTSSKCMKKIKYS